MYLEEAHPTDGWMYGAVEHAVAQHTGLDDRLAAARLLRAALDGVARVDGAGLPPPIPLYADLPENGASIAFGALPERLAILLDGRVAFIGGPGPGDYSVPAAERALEALLKRA